jgi:peptide chain release factor 1
MKTALQAVESRLKRFEELERLLADPAVASDPKQVRQYAKELSGLRPLAEKFGEYRRLAAQKASAEDLISRETGEMQQMARAELEELKAQLEAIEKELEVLLIEEDPEDERSAIVEIRAGTGGAEASLFAADLYRMYTRYAQQNGWKIEPLSMAATEVGGFKEAVFAIEGTGVFRKLKFERGVHRVQRVPDTESAGRIHTSTVTVAVLPQAEEVDVQINAQDLKIDVFRSSGPGGQSVNTTDSAVRITHVPTGVVVQCQDERSQLKNKAKAMKVLLARLLEHKIEEQHAKRASDRKSQIGSGDRSEKIRTYNFPDRRITDHRIGFTSHRLEEVLNGAMEELVVPLLEAQRQERLKQTFGGSA